MQTMKREAASLEAPITKKRRQQREAGPSVLPGLDFIEAVLPPVRQDGLWRNAETILCSIAELGGYRTQCQQRIGKIHGQKYVVDLLCRLPGEDDVIAVSCKWQREGGSFDKKIPADARDLGSLLRGEIKRGYVVVMGTAITPEKIDRWNAEAGAVRIINTDFFMVKAWCRAL